MTLFRTCILVGLIWFGASTSRPQTRGASASRRSSPMAPDFEQAKYLLAQGSLEQAADAVKHGLARSPRNVTGLNLLGVIYHQQGKFVDAVAVLQQALALSPRSVDTLNNLATSYAAESRTDLAQETFGKALRLQPRNGTANYNLALLLLGGGRPKEAATYLARIPSPDAATRLNLVRAYLNAGMTSAGLTSAEQLSRDFPKETKVHFSLGVLLASNRQYPMAVHEFELANALEPATFEILHDLGQAYLLHGQPVKAQQELDQALHLQPDSADTLYLLAQAAADLQKDVDALELLVRARKIAPANSEILFLMARLSMKQSFFEDAIELLNEGVKIDPHRAEFHAALGESYFTTGKVEKALQEFKTLVALDPSPRSYVFMGLCYRHLGQYEEAKRFLNLALQVDSNNLPALYNLGFIARKQQDYVPAEQYLGRALRADPNYPDALFELGSLEMEQKKYAEAVPLLRRCAEVSTKPAEAYYKLALAERSSHQLEAAQRDMNIFKTLSKNPQPGPFPLQHFFDYLERRSGLSAEQQNETDLRELEAEVRQHPDRPRSLYLLAEAFLKLSRTQDAIEVIKRLDEVSGGDFRTELSTGVLLGRFRMYPAAIQYFQAALKANPASDDAKYNLATVYFQSGNYENALPPLLQISPDGQKDGSYWALIGDVYAHLDRGNDAVRAFEQAVLSAPDNDQGYVSLALAQLRAGDGNGADATVRNGLARIPDSGALYWAAGVVAVVRGQARDAEDYLRKAAALMPSRETAFATLGVFYYEAGRIAEAREVLGRCMEMFPQGTMDVQKISAALDAASKAKLSSQPPGELSLEARREFYQMAVAMADQEH